MSKNFAALVIACGLLLNACDGRVSSQQTTSNPTTPPVTPPVTPPTEPPTTPPVVPPVTPPVDPGEPVVQPTMRCAPKVGTQQMAHANSCSEVRS